MFHNVDKLSRSMFQMMAERPVHQFSGIERNRALLVVDGTDDESEVVPIGEFTIIGTKTMSVAIARVASRLATARNLKRCVETRGNSQYVPVCGVALEQSKTGME